MNYPEFHSVNLLRPKVSSGVALQKGEGDFIADHIIVALFGLVFIFNLVCIG